VTREGIALSMVAEDPYGDGYVCAMYFGDKRVRVLPPAEAAAYCAELTWVITVAEHEAAVLAQLEDMGLPLPLRAQTVRHLRADRRPTIEAATAPIAYTPIVSHRTQKGMVNGVIRVPLTGQELPFQWDLDTARQHVMYVMEVSAGADIDGLYRQHLTGLVGLGKREATDVVTLLRNFMPSTSHKHERPPGKTP